MIILPLLIITNVVNTDFNKCLEDISDNLSTTQYNREVDICHELHVKDWQENQDFYIKMSKLKLGE